MSPARPLPAGESQRKLVHAGMAGFALLLPFLPWWGAALCAVGAFAFNLVVLPRLVGHRMTSDRSGASDRGVLLYPVVVLAMIMVFWRDLTFAAVGWGFLAWGDAAAGVVGMKWGRRPLPWNTRKSWEGLGGGLVGAFAGGGLLLLAFQSRLQLMWPWPAVSPADALVRISLLLLVGGLVFALVESAPLGIDDNLVAPVVGAICVHAVLAPLTVAGLSRPVWPYWITDPQAWLVAVAVNGACAILAMWKRVLTPAGVVGAIILGLGTWILGGIGLWIVLLSFLVLGTAVTTVGWKRKSELGIAEHDLGRRGLGNVAGKGAVVLAAAALTPVANPDLCAVLAVSALAAALADTAGSEIGKALGRVAYALPSLRAVAPGTSGAVSVVGSAATVGGAAVIAALAMAVRVVDMRLAALCALVGVGTAFLESGFSREVSHDSINLTLTVVAATVGAGLMVLLGW